MNTLELAKTESRAFEAMSEAYQADDCLEFWYEDSVLYAKPKDNQVGVLGEWVCFFDGDIWVEEV